MCVRGPCVPQGSVAASWGPAGYGNCPDVTRGVLAAQEDAVDYKLSVFRLFAELFPEFTNSGGPIRGCLCLWLGARAESLCLCAIATAPRTSACAFALGVCDVMSHLPRKHAQAATNRRLDHCNKRCARARGCREAWPHEALTLFSSCNYF